MDNKNKTELVYRFMNDGDIINLRQALRLFPLTVTFLINLLEYSVEACDYEVTEELIAAIPLNPDYNPYDYLYPLCSVKGEHALRAIKTAFARYNRTHTFVTRAAGYRRINCYRSCIRHNNLILLDYLRYELPFGLHFYLTKDEFINAFTETDNIDIFKRLFHCKWRIIGEGIQYVEFLNHAALRRLPNITDMLLQDFDLYVTQVDFSNCGCLTNTIPALFRFRRFDAAMKTINLWRRIAPNFMYVDLIRPNFIYADLLHRRYPIRGIRAIRQKDLSFPRDRALAVIKNQVAQYHIVLLILFSNAFLDRSGLDRALIIHLLPYLEYGYDQRDLVKFSAFVKRIQDARLNHIST